MCAICTPQKTGADIALVVDGNGNEFEYDCYRAAAQAIYPVIPAQPGFVLLSVYFNAGPIPEDLSEWVCRAPIIGWRMATLGPEPVTLNDADGCHEQGIQCPDGQIEVIADATYKDLDAFLAEVRIRWQAHIEAVAKKNAALTVVKPE
jgi:hypothetical protein